ncbi:hypothetical protein ND861_03875 [Leptospira sp. 2 VSF19]|uniref:FAD/FMN-containing dehydrogenase n=1 Tax=Leptospira soteropolitanensis TaxID=2950025 RepID=A0AAW5VL91_9LEPT|nr:hypothetical protein [Leptospira soteropolitanensis]MCW7491785.1 hypothetical protein [Leptospira soteropolitanensis]MCW7499369.1 hypothetical protein [Leptospira soteropolitanensis]MCW7521040.1 hypothetical protein [Leptospira soteropolitanensis]MCW7525473.1 hypothetical protein [Leptospira soteropolitanensis]MCW7529339.1 hypothetical protein [Leptospira soteropolitanensis]
MNQFHISKSKFVMNIKPNSIFQTSIRLLLVYPIFLFALSLSAEEQATPPLVVGNPLPEINFTNQWEEPSPIPAETTKVIFIADMDASKIIHPILEKEGKGYLESKQAVLISDIHRMPTLITKFVALPKMKSYPYTLRLVKEEKIADPFPRTKGSLTLIQLKSGKITKIQISNAEAEIRSFLETQEKTSKSDR